MLKPLAHVPQVVDAGAAAAKALGLKWQKMVSRAYHDSLFMSKVCLF